MVNPVADLGVTDRVRRVLVPTTITTGADVNDPAGNVTGTEPPAPATVAATVTPAPVRTLNGAAASTASASSCSRYGTSGASVGDGYGRAMAGVVGMGVS